MEKRIPALTLWRPWLACFTDLPEPVAKRHENRPWATSYRGPVYLHNGKRWDDAALMVAADVERGHGRKPTLSPDQADHPAGIIAVAELVGICSESAGTSLYVVCDCGPWAFPGQHHWQFTNVRKLAEPVPCPGRQQLWYPPADVAERAAALALTA